MGIGDRKGRGILLRIIPEIRNSTFFFWESKGLELYDLESDPGETTNLLDQEPRIAEELSAEIRAWIAEPRLAPRYRSSGGLYEQ